MSAIISRSTWGARRRNGVGSRPTGRLEKYLHHTVTAHLKSSASINEESRQMRILEDIGEQRFKGGISYSFLVFPSGRIYEGASVGRISYHSGSGRNTRGVGIALVGNFESNSLNTAAFNSIVWLLQEGARKGWWSDPALTEYHKQFRATSCPGRHAISRFSDLNKAGRGGKVSVTTPKPTPPKSTSQSIGRVMETNKKGVEVWRRNNKSSGVIGTMSAEGYGVFVERRQGNTGSWAEIAWKGGVGWVEWKYLREAKGATASKPKVWPQVNVPVTNKHTRASHNAWVRMLAGIKGQNFTSSNLTRNIQNWLQWNGYYKKSDGFIVDGKWGKYTTRELQRFLKAKGFYKATPDFTRGPVTVRAEINYINSQRKHFV